MNCLKCGREVEENQVFCADCLLDMEKHPVKPGTVVFLPRNRDASLKKIYSRRRVAPSPEEQVKQLKKRVRIFSFLLAVMIALSVFFGWFAVQYFLENDPLLPGQNYSTAEHSSDTETD